MKKQKLMIFFISTLLVGTKANAGIFDKIVAWWNQKPMTLHQQKRLAFALAFHHRLGSDSPVHRLPGELFRQIFELVESDKVVMWREACLRERRRIFKHAIESGNERLFNSILSAGINGTSWWEGYNGTNLALANAVRCKRIPFVRALLEANADPNAKSKLLTCDNGDILSGSCKEHQTLLHEAARRSQVEIVQLLIDAHANINDTTGCETPLDMAQKYHQHLTPSAARIVQMLRAARGKTYNEIWKQYNQGPYC